MSPQDDDLPSYDCAISDGTTRSHTLPIHVRVQQEVHSQLSNLGQQISQGQVRQLRELYEQDRQVLDSLIPFINSFLEDYSKSGLVKAKLVLVPASRVSPDATLAGEDLIKDDEYFRVERVSGLLGSRTFWDDGDIARRVAAYLQPTSDTRAETYNESKPATDLLPPRARSPDRKRTFWKKPTSGLRNIESETQPPRAFSDEMNLKSPLVTMSVTAEDVAFRTQTPFGLYGNESGVAIAVDIYVQLK